MNRMLFGIFFAAMTMLASGQGQLHFSNLAPAAGVNAPIRNAAGDLIAGPSPYVADLFWSISTTSPTDGLVPYGFNQGFLPVPVLPGYFNGGAATFALPETATILVQVRVWDTTFGPTYAQARDHGGEFGYSNPILVSLSAPPGTPTELIGLLGFQLQVVPEPSSLSLVVLAGVTLSWRLRKRPDGVDP